MCVCVCKISLVFRCPEVRAVVVDVYTRVVIVGIWGRAEDGRYDAAVAPLLSVVALCRQRCYMLRESRGGVYKGGLVEGRERTKL